VYLRASALRRRQRRNASAAMAERLARGYGAEPHFKNTFEDK
jgi:hypothetical protein